MIGFVSGAALPTAQRCHVAPSSPRHAVQMGATGGMSRREALQFALSAALAAVAAPIAPALADGSVSGATKNRVRFQRGARIYELGTDVDKLPSLIDGNEWVKIMNLVSSKKDKEGTFVEARRDLRLFKTGFYADSRTKQNLLGAYEEEFNQAVGQLENAAKQKNKERAKKAAGEIRQAWQEYIAFGKLGPNEWENAPGANVGSDFDFRRKLPKG